MLIMEAELGHKLNVFLCVFLCMYLPCMNSFSGHWCVWERMVQGD